MRSMTGYGKAIAEQNGRRFTVELKAVNHRFLDFYIKMPKTFGFCEPTVRKVLKANLTRGHIDVFVGYEDLRQDRRELVVNFALAERYLRAATELKSRLSIANNLSANEVLRLPEIVTEKEVKDDEDLLLTMLTKAVEDACAALNKMRLAEGKELKADISRRVKELARLRDVAEARAPAVAEEYAEKLAARMAELLAGTPVDEHKLINEVAFFAERAAVDEELTRLEAHLTQLDELTNSPNGVGRELEFILQEVNREINTLGSKSNDYELALLVVRMKSEAEKIREQIQNVE